MNRSNRIKYWVMFIVIGCFSLSLGCTAHYPVSGIALMPLCDCQTIFRMAQKMMETSGYTLLQSDAEKGILSGQTEIGDTLKIMSFQIAIDGNERVKILMVVDTSEIILPPPSSLARGELVKIAKTFAKQMSFSENDVLMQFDKEQKPLSFYALMIQRSMR